MTLDYYKEFIVASASVCQIVQLLSGVLVCLKFIRKGSSNDVSPLPFICGYTSCVLWANYGILIDEFAVKWVNIFGAIAMFHYVLTIYLYTTRKMSILKQMLGSIIFIVAVYFYKTSISDPQVAKEHLGLISCGVTLLFFAAPLSSLAHVIRTKSSESLPFPLILMSLIVTAQWTIYGFLINDKFIEYPNLLGFLLSFFQLCLFLIYPMSR